MSALTFRDYVFLTENTTFSAFLTAYLEFGNSPKPILSAKKAMASKHGKFKHTSSS